MRPPGDIVLSGVRKRFARRGDWVLDGIDLRLAPGSTTVVVGANGTGKSTLLRLTAGLLDPTAGRIDGRPPGPGVGYAPDRLGTRARMSALVYVDHMARIRGCDPTTARVRRDELFAQLELRPGPEAPIRSLSKGNSQKVALTQALISPVDLLILDEPYGGLDVAARDEISRLVAERADRGAAVLVSAHTPVTALEPAQTFLLERGRLTPGAASTAQTLRMVLTAKTTAADARELERRPGVMELTRDGATVAIVVAATTADDFLAYALSVGWSVTSVA